MGAFGCGPMDNDDALDLVDTIAFDPSRAESLLMPRFLELTHVASGPMYDVRDVSVDMALALASCAVVADAVRGQYFYTRPPLGPGDDLYDPKEREFSLGMVDLSEDLEKEARRALARYRELERDVIDLGWSTPDTYEEHRTMLAELGMRLDRDAKI